MFLVTFFTNVFSNAFFFFNVAGTQLSLKCPIVYALCIYVWIRCVEIKIGFEYQEFSIESKSSLKCLFCDNSSAVMQSILTEEKSHKLYDLVG